ncbi:MAG: hypothetical protein H0X33_07615 [Taibaiella sp.]|nr:hypothetical protein [Taibaiella sp.]
MKLYPKNISSIKQLQLEKQMLKRAAKKNTLEDIFSFGKSDDKEEEKGTANESGPLKIALSLIGAESRIGAILKFAPSIIRLFGNSKRETYSRPKQSGNLLFKVAFEVLGGYLKWKAVEFGYKGIRNYFRSRKPNTL